MGNFQEVMTNFKINYWKKITKELKLINKQ